MALALPPTEDPVTALQLLSDSIWIHILTKNSKKLQSAAGAVLKYTAELITRFFPLVNISAVTTAGIFKRVENNSSLK